MQQLDNTEKAFIRAAIENHRDGLMDCNSEEQQKLIEVTNSCLSKLGLN